MDLYPGARRVLLTAYADTDAAIDAINVVDLDYYLLKPWDPPEEKLYPVIDAHARGVARRPTTGRCPRPRSSGTAGRPARPRCASSWPATRCPTAGTAPTSPEGKRLLEAAGVGRARRCRWSSPPDGDGARRSPPTPSSPAQVGLSTTPAERLLRPRRRSAAARPGSAPRCTARPRACATVLVERTATGGQAGQSSRIENYLGFPDGVSGAQLTDRARRQACKFGAELITTRDVVGARGQRRGPHGPVRRRRRSSTRTPSSSPPASPTGSSAAAGIGRAHRPRRLLRLGAHRGGRLRRPGRLHRRRRQLRRPGGGLPRPARPHR